MPGTRKEGEKMIRILLADDHEIFRNGLRRLINQESDMEVAAEAENGRQAVEILWEASPDVVIMDVTMPDMNGIDAARKIIARCPNVKVIALSMYDDNRYVAGMFCAGASGYLMKDCTFEEVADAVRAVARNQTYLSPRIASIIVSNYLGTVSGSVAATAPSLTQREREVLQLLTEGISTKAITSRLHLSKKTIESHRRSIRKKLKLRSMAELTKYAIRSGLIRVDY